MLKDLLIVAQSLSMQLGKSSVLASGAKYGAARVMSQLKIKDYGLLRVLVVPDILTTGVGFTAAAELGSSFRS